MATVPSGLVPWQDPTHRLEQALIEGFLVERGYSSRSVEGLPPDERRHLLEESARYASGKLSEIEARAHFVQDLHRR